MYIYIYIRIHHTYREIGTISNSDFRNIAWLDNFASFRDALDRPWKSNMDMTLWPEELWRLGRWFID